MTFHVQPTRTSCLIERVVVERIPFGEPGEPRRNGVFVASGQPNLADPKLDKIELWDRKARSAMVLRPKSFYFFEDVDPSAKLKEEIEDTDEPGDCCYGSTSWEVSTWEYEGPGAHDTDPRSTSQ